jgi:hypothetical protein
MPNDTLDSRAQERLQTTAKRTREETGSRRRKVEDYSQIYLNIYMYLFLYNTPVL